MNENFNWKQHIHDITIKLNRTDALFSIIRNYVNKHTLRTICFAMFDSHINSINLIWCQKTIILQKKALRIMNFQSRDSHSNLLFRSNHILKYLQKIFFLSVSHLITFFPQSLKAGSPSALMFTIITVSCTTDKIFKLSYTTDSYENTPIFDHANAITIKVTFSFLKYVLACKKFSQIHLFIEIEVPYLFFTTATPNIIKVIFNFPEFASA